MTPQIIRLTDRPAVKPALAVWLHEKWGIPVSAYEESMVQSLSASGGVPSWYAILDGDRIIGGAGVIENDFHNRPDLTPNVCALYVEPDFRGRGLAGRLLDQICADMGACGVATLYLLTDHTSFYERYGWEFLCPVQGDGEETPSRMYVKKT